jgi:prepilin-type processing-associated H-X9-DG protein
LPNSWKQARDGISGYGWAVSLLPYLDESALRQKIDDNLPISAWQNDMARERDISMMRCPSDISEQMFDLHAEAHYLVDDSNAPTGSTEPPTANSLIRLPTANYAGVFGTIEADDSFPAPRGDGAIVSDYRVRLADLERGLSHTIVVGERTMAMVPTTWFGVNFHGEDAACRLVGSAMTAPNCDFCDECEFTSRHPGGVNFVWADGHVSLISREIEAHEYRLYARRRLN